MRILHTADWHIGAKTDDLDRSEEIKLALSEIVKIAKDKNVDMVLIAGDVYDTLVPSAESENLLYNTLSQLSNNGDTAVVAIAGNHDEPKRLSNASVFASRFNIYLVGYYDEIKIPTPNTGRNIYATECGKGYIKFKTASGEEAVVVCLPYPSYYRYRETKKDTDNLNDSIKSWMAEGESKFGDDTINIFMTHIMSYGGAVEHNDNLYVSSPFPYVDSNVYKSRAHYTALGHIHKYMCLSDERNVYYTGSILNTNFSPNNENEKWVNVVDIDAKNGVTNIEKISLPAKKLLNFEGKDIERLGTFCKEHPDDYVKAVVTSERVYSYDELKELRKNNPNLVTLSVITDEIRQLKNVESKKDLTNSEIFEKFVFAKKGEAPKPEVKELFLKLMGENLYEAD